MKARILTGSKKEIADQVVGIDGEIREAIVFIDEPAVPTPAGADIFAEMEPFTVHASPADDSREAVYRRGADE
ncbi:hypothetical protein RAS1_38760 [Phycisphaerae bacterium RAS1]|nr:hypothetical protein RAS1_38760 [Phycisphaerae bacterium RAS1]